MIRILSLSVLLIGLLNTTLTARDSPNYEITGHFENIPVGYKVNMWIFGTNDWKIDGDTATVIKTGEFHISGIIHEGPRQYEMRISNPNDIIILKLFDYLSIVESILLFDVGMSVK